MADDYFSRWLEEEEGRRGFFYNALRPGFGLNSIPNNRGFMPSQRNFLQSLFPQIQNQFLGAQAGRIAQGGQPDIKWTDWLGQNFRPDTELLRASPYKTGTATTPFRSPTRFLYQ